MQAMILAGGKATRLGEASRSTPKCMQLVNGVPMLEHTIGHLRGYGYHDIIIALHRHPEIPIAYFGYGDRFDVRIMWSLEPNQLGTAGAVANVYPILEPEEPLLVWYGDNLSTINLQRLRAAHFETDDGYATIATYKRLNVAASGVVVTQGGRVTAFIEKPVGAERRLSRWVNAGIFFVAPTLVDSVVQQINAPVVDFGYHVFPHMLKCGIPIRVYRMQDPEILNWVDTPEDLAETRRVWEGT